MLKKQLDKRLPTRMILLDMIEESCYLLSGLASKELKIEDKEIAERTSSVLGKAMCISTMIDNNEELQVKLIEEQDEDFHSIVKAMDEDAFMEVMETFREDAGDGPADDVLKQAMVLKQDDSKIN